MQTRLLQGGCCEGGGGGVGGKGEWRQSSRDQIQAAGCGDHLRQEWSFLVSSNLETIWSWARCIGEARRKASHSLCPDQRRSTADSQTPQCRIYGFHIGRTPRVRPRGSNQVPNTCRHQPVKSTRPGVSPSLLAITLSQVTEVLLILKTLNSKFASIVKHLFAANISQCRNHSTTSMFLMDGHGCHNVNTAKGKKWKRFSEISTWPSCTS